MKLAMTALATIAMAGTLAACDRDGSATHTSTTVVKEPQVVQREKETVIQKDSPAPASAAPAAPAPSSSSSVTVDASTPQVKPEANETTKSTTTSRVDTPMGTATKTETTRTETTK